MKVYKDCTLLGFDAWSGAVETKDRIIAEHKEDVFEAYIEEMYPEGISETELNDLLWFDSAEIFRVLNIKKGE